MESFHHLSGMFGTEQGLCHDNYNVGGNRSDTNAIDTNSKNTLWLHNYSDNLYPKLISSIA